MKSKLVAAMSAAFVVVLASPASAGRFLAETFVKPFSPSLARKLDKEHAKLGTRSSISPTSQPVQPRTPCFPALDLP